MTQKCLACGHPCEAALAFSTINCTNPKCKWFHPEAKEILEMMAEAERLLAWAR